MTWKLERDFTLSIINCQFFPQFFLSSKCDGFVHCISFSSNVDPLWDIHRATIVMILRSRLEFFFPILDLIVLTIVASGSCLVGDTISNNPSPKTTTK